MILFLVGGRMLIINLLLSMLLLFLFTKSYIILTPIKILLSIQQRNLLIINSYFWFMIHPVYMGGIRLEEIFHKAQLENLRQNPFQLRVPRNMIITL